MHRKHASMGRRAMQLCYLCASISPSLAGLPYLMEYVWNLMSTRSAWHRTCK